MRFVLFALIVLVAVSSVAMAETLADSMGVIRVFGDSSSRMSSCFVVGDGSWVITTSDSITEQIGSDTEHIIRNPVFISAYTGQAYQCELKANNKALNVAVLKLPISGLPAAPLAKLPDFSKTVEKTMGELFSGEQIGNKWPTEIFGITREKTSGGYKLTVAEWKAANAFLTEMDKYKWLFVTTMSPDTPIPNGSIIVRGPNVVGMYLNKLVITGGKSNIVFGRCAMSTDIARYLGDQSVSTANLYDPPKPTVNKPEGAAGLFQLQTLLYSQIADGKMEAAAQTAASIVKAQPKDAQAQLMLGVALTGAGKAEDALKAFDEATKLNAKLPTLRMNRALALVALKKTAEAESELLKAEEEYPNDSRPVVALADFYMGDDKTLDKALIYAKKAVTMITDTPSALMLAARVEKRKKNYTSALNYITQALKMVPNMGEAIFALGVVFEESGDMTNAEKAYRLLVNKQPKDPTAMLTLASFLADQDKKDEAKELIGKVRELKPPKEVLEAAQSLQDKIDGKQPPAKEPESKT